MPSLTRESNQVLVATIVTPDMCKGVIPAIQLFVVGFCGRMSSVGRDVGIAGDQIKYIDTQEAIKERHVDLNLVAVHENLGVCFGRKRGEF